MRRAVLGLLSKGVPASWIEEWDSIYIQAASIILGELESGTTFNFETMSWPELR